MTKTPLLIALGIAVLFGGLFKCDAFSEETPIAETPPMSEPPFLPDEYTILCNSEQSTGFNWENGDWVAVRFKETKRLIVKSDNNVCDVDKTYSMPNEKIVCLNIRKMGDKYQSVQGSYNCLEMYLNWPRGWETIIMCNDAKMSLNPNGRYNYAHIHNQLEEHPYKDLKDSMWVEVGKCSMITP